MAYTQYQYANNAISYLTININTTDTIIKVQEGEGAIFPEAPFLVTLESEVQGVVNAREIVKVIEKSGDTFTIERGAGVCVQNDSVPMKTQGNTPLDFPVGSRVCQYIQAELFDNIIQGVVEQSGVRAGSQESIVGNVATFSDTNGHEIIDSGKKLEDYVTNSNLSDTLNDYVTSEEMGKTLDDALDAKISYPATGSTGQVLKKTSSGVERADETKQHSTLQLTLTTSGWNNGTQTITATGVTTSNAVIVSPSPDNMKDYADALIYCSAQGSNSLTFTCTEVPENNIVVNVLILN